MTAVLQTNSHTT